MVQSGLDEFIFSMNDSCKRYVFRLQISLSKATKYKGNDARTGKLWKRQGMQACNADHKLGTCCFVLQTEDNPTRMYT